MSAVMIRPGPMADTIATSMKKGSVRSRHVGQNWNHAMRAARMVDAIAKSTSDTTTELAGTIMRGKYTFVMRFELLTMLWLDEDNALAKNCHGSMAANT